MISPKIYLNALNNLESLNPIIIDILYSSYKDSKNLSNLDNVYTYIGIYRNIDIYFTMHVDKIKSYVILEPRGIRYNALRYEFYYKYRNPYKTVILQ